MKYVVRAQHTVLPYISSQIFDSLLNIRARRAQNIKRNKKGREKGAQPRLFWSNKGGIEPTRGTIE